jgi:hypothetical protein
MMSLPTSTLLGGKAGIARANRELLAAILFELARGIRDPLETQDICSAHRRSSIFYAVALSLELGYEAGVDPLGYAHIELPTGHVAFWVPFSIGALVHPHGSVVKECVDAYWRLVHAPE